MNGVTVKEWKEMFSELGLLEDDMHKWHQLFENRYPRAHQSFLEWLGVDAARRATIGYTLKKKLSV